MSRKGNVKEKERDSWNQTIRKGKHEGMEIFTPSREMP